MQKVDWQPPAEISQAFIRFAAWVVPKLSKLVGAVSAFTEVVQCALTTPYHHGCWLLICAQITSWTDPVFFLTHRMVFLILFKRFDINWFKHIFDKSLVLAIVLSFYFFSWQFVCMIIFFFPAFSQRHYFSEKRIKQVCFGNLFWKLPFLIKTTAA